MSRLQVVDRIAADATVLLDLDDGTNFCLDVESRFPPPALKASYAGGVLADGEVLNASAYTNRVLELVLGVPGPGPDAVGVRLGALHRAFNEARGVLRYVEEDASEPVYFRYFRSGGYDPTWAPRFVLGKLRLKVNAEPAAIGHPIVAHDPVVVSNDPAAGSNGLFFDVGDVQGELATPMHITWLNPGGVPTTALVAVRRHGVPSDGIYVRQCEDFTLGTDTAVVAAADYSGGSAARITFATNPGLVERMRAQIPGEPGVTTPARERAYRGRYRVLALLDQGVFTEYEVRLRWGGVVGDTTPVPHLPQGMTGKIVADLGLINVPTEIAPTEVGYSGQAIGASPIQLLIDAARLSGTDPLTFDYLVFAPADEEMSIVRFPRPYAQYVWDGPNGRVYAGATSTSVTSGTVEEAAVWGNARVEPIGAIPNLTPGPGPLNRVFFLPHVESRNQNGGEVLPTSTATLRVTYWPRYLHVREP